MGNNNKNADWKSMLKEYGKQLREEMTPEEKQKEEKEKQDRIFRKNEIDRRKPRLYKFLAGYKQNSGILINNFFRKRDFQMYCEDKFHDFSFDFSGGILPNVFDDFGFSMKMAHYLHLLDEEGVAYYKIDKDYIDYLINFAIVMDLCDPLEEDTVFYRGCSSLDRNGVNGLVSVSSDYRIAEQFSRGTILKIHVPKGTKIVNINAVRPKDQRKKDLEQEYLIPPCDYEIINAELKDKGDELNNYKNKTAHIELTVTPLDLLEEFLNVMHNPPEEFEQYRNLEGYNYDEAVEHLERFVETRNRKRKQQELTKSLKINS